MRSKKIRRFRKAIGRVFRFILKCLVVLFAAGLFLFYYPEIERYFDRFTAGSIATSEIDTYYDLLSKYQKPATDLVMDLSVKDTDSLGAAIEKLKVIMGLGDCVIGLAYHDNDKPPAYIKRQGEDMTIFVSRRVKDRREEINLLAHEMTHIYVWRLDNSIFGACDQEKLVDCASVYLGLGVLSLNGLTDEVTMLPDGGCEARKKTFGYLKPEQFGYLLARYCSDHDIKDDAVKPYLNSAGWKYYIIGRRYLNRKALRTNSPEGSITPRSILRRSSNALRAKLTGIFSEAK